MNSPLAIGLPFLRLVYGVALSLGSYGRVLLHRGECSESDGVAACLLRLFRLPLSLLLRLRLLAGSLCRHVARPDDVVVAHSCHAPCEGSRQQDAAEEELRTQYAPTVDEEFGEVYLQSVVQRCAGGDEEVCHRLPSAQLLVLQYQLARHVESQEQ